MIATRKARVVHLTAAHPACDIRIHRKECVSLLSAGYAVALVAPRIEGLPQPSSDIELVWLPHVRSRMARIGTASCRVLSAALRCRGDLYHAHDPELLPCLAALKWLGKTVVFDMHENTPKAILTKGWIPSAFRKPSAHLYRLVERLFLSGIPVVFAEDSYRADYPWVRTSAMVRNYPILDELLGISEPPYEKPTVAYLGVVAPQRGSWTMLEAVRRCWRRGVLVDLEYIGRVDEGHRRALLASVPADAPGQLRVRGYLPPDESWRLLARAHIGAAVLYDIPNYVDSVPTKVLEYMALGKPVIASDFPLYRSIIAHSGAGICVSPRDVEAVAAAVERLATRPADAAAMGERGRAASVSLYSWRAEADRLLAFYDALLCSSTRPAAGESAALHRIP